MQDIDTGLLQVQYEIFGESPESLAEQYGISTAMMKYIIDNRKLKRLPLAQNLQDWSNHDVVDLDEDLLKEVDGRLKILQTIKSQTLSPKYVALETVILSKLQTVAQNIDVNEPGAAARIKTVVDAFQSLRAQTFPSAKTEGSGKDGGGLKLQVNIMGQVPSDYEPAQHQTITIESNGDNLKEVG